MLILANLRILPTLWINPLFLAPQQPARFHCAAARLSPAYRLLCALCAQKRQLVSEISSVRLQVRKAPNSAGCHLPSHSILKSSSKIRIPTSSDSIILSRSGGYMSGRSVDLIP